MFCRTSFDTAKHPLTLNRVPSIILSPTDLALVIFDDPIRTADLLRAAFQVLEHGFPAEHTPVSDRMVTARIRKQFPADAEPFSAPESKRTENMVK